jgi:adenosylmethionine-8-amino-7-oxononanoate aminotransferase
MSLVNSLARRDAAVLLHPQTDWRAHEESGALVVTRGEGIHVFDEDDKGYIEGMAGLWCTALGFSEPRLVEAARRQMSLLPYEHCAMGDTMGFSPPLVISETEIVEMFARFARALDEIAGSVLPAQRAA